MYSSTGLKNIRSRRKRIKEAFSYYAEPRHKDIVGEYETSRKGRELIESKILLKSNQEEASIQDMLDQNKGCLEKKESFENIQDGFLAIRNFDKAVSGQEQNFSKKVPKAGKA